MAFAHDWQLKGLVSYPRKPTGSALCGVLTMRISRTSPSDGGFRNTGEDLVRGSKKGGDEGCGEKRFEAWIWVRLHRAQFPTEKSEMICIYCKYTFMYTEYIYIYAYMCSSISISICMCIYIYIFRYICICIHIYIFSCIMQNMYIHMCIYANLNHKKYDLEYDLFTHDVSYLRYLILYLTHIIRYLKYF